VQKHPEKCTLGRSWMSWEVSINMNLEKRVLRSESDKTDLKESYTIIIFGVEPLGYKFRESVKQ
jgi:hypothetical protein